MTALLFAASWGRNAFTLPLKAAALASPPARLADANLPARVSRSLANAGTRWQEGNSGFSGFSGGRQVGRFWGPLRGNPDGKRRKPRLKLPWRGGPTGSCILRGIQELRMEMLFHTTQQHEGGLSSPPSLPVVAPSTG